jgi:hypothetical protein
VDDAADVASVNAHAEGDRGHDDIQSLAREVLLDPAPLIRGEAGVIGLCLDAVGLQPNGE